MQRTRHIIAVALVATALCADRASSAVPSLQPAMVNLASRLAGRLSGRFTRVVPATALFQTSRGTSSQRQVPQSIAADFSAPPVPTLSPFLFRLPPPTA